MGPAFALLDEPASGMHDADCAALMQVISGLPARLDCGVLLIEHTMTLIMGVCERIHVLDGRRSQAADGAGRADRGGVGDRARGLPPAAGSGPGDAADLLLRGELFPAAADPADPHRSASATH